MICVHLGLGTRQVDPVAVWGPLVEHLEMLSSGFCLRGWIDRKVWRCLCQWGPGCPWWDMQERCSCGQQRGCRWRVETQQPVCPAAEPELRVLSPGTQSLSRDSEARCHGSFSAQREAPVRPGALSPQHPSPAEHLSLFSGASLYESFLNGRRNGIFDRYSPHCYLPRKKTSLLFCLSE